MPRDDEFTLSIESPDFDCNDLEVRSFTGKEAISRLFSYELEVVCSRHDGPSADTMTGARITLVIERREGAGSSYHGARRLHGLVAEVSDRLAEHADLRVYRLRMVPRAFALTLVETQDIFIDQSVPELIQDKVAAVALEGAMEIRLLGSYATREFVVQHSESDLAFISRLAEHLGISFFFDHGDEHETMVFTDHAGGFSHVDAGGPINYRSRGEQRDVFALEATRTMIPAFFAVRDYNYRAPLVDLGAHHELSEGFAGGVIEFGSHYKTPGEGETLAKVRAEERLAGQLVYTGRSTIPALGAGLRFTLEDHPDLGTAELLVTEVVHQGTRVVRGLTGSEAPGYQNTFKAIPAERTYRPARVTPRPRIAGLVTGIVDAGPVGGTPRIAQIDEQGRYWVRFHFDTTAAGERPASRPVRMLQNHAGANHGTHFPLKPGVEVAVGFINGDPDRPIIVGAIPNPTQPSPVTNAEATVHRIRTSTGITIDLVE